MSTFRFLLLSVLLFANEAKCQQLSKSDLLEDLVFLNKAIRNGHPVNYQRAEKIGIDSLISHVRREAPDSVSWRWYEDKVREAVYQIGCVHTSIQNSPIRRMEKVKNGFFPLEAFTDGVSLFVQKDFQDTGVSLKQGDQVLLVNGISADSLLREMMTYKSPDGKGITFVRQIVNRNFAALYFIYFGASETFEVEYLRKGIRLKATLQGSDKSALKAKEIKIDVPEGFQPVFKTDKGFFGVLPGDIAYLRIESFKKKYKSFYRHVFKYLEAHPSLRLVIDLRDNLGGSRANAEKLLSYLLPEKASYQIIRPKQNMGDYLHGKERMKFWSSFLYFDFQKLFARKKLEDGVAFTYKIKPRKQIYSGQIYVLANGYSASSSTVVASYLRHHAKAIIIGEQTAGGEYMNNGGSYPNLVLPKSGIEIRTATYHFAYDFGNVSPDGIVPEHVVQYNVETFLQTDLEMQLVRALINGQSR